MKTIECKVKTNAKADSIKFKNNLLIVELSAKPVRGQANKELIKLLEKELGKNVEIVKGKKNHKKLIKIE